MLNLKRLQYLDAVYQYKNFTQASEALYVSQPAISSAVQALEEELGVRLVVRSSKGVTFTYEGEQFMIWARRILSTCEAAENAMRDLAGTAPAAGNLPRADESHRAHDLLHLSAGAPQGADLPERGLHEQARGDGDG